MTTLVRMTKFKFLFYIGLSMIKTQNSSLYKKTFYLFYSLTNNWIFLFLKNLLET